MTTPSRFLHKPLWCHFLLSVLGLIGITQKIANKFGVMLENSLNSHIQYSDAYISVVDTSKLASIFQYVLVIVILGLYFTSLVVFFTRIRAVSIKPFYSQEGFSTAYIGYLGLLLFINTLLLTSVPGNWFFCVSFFLGWLVLVLSPVLKLPPLISLFKKLGGAENTIRRSAYVLLMLVLLQTGWLFVPFIGSQQLRIINDYYGVAEQTRISNHLVNNKDYFAAHSINGLAQVNLTSLPPSSVQFFASLNTNPQEMLMCKHLRVAECNQLRAHQVTDLSGYTSEEQSFVTANAYELTRQEIAGYYFHHQNALLAPLNEYVLGKPIAKINFLYGYGNSLLLVKAVSWLGNFSFSVIEKVLVGFYPLYYVFFVLLAVLLFRNIYLVLLAFLLSMSAFQFIGFDQWHYAPGFNPMRHFLDLSVIAAFYGYLSRKRFCLAYLSIAFGLAVLAIFANKEFGWLLYIALSAVFLAHYCLEKVSKTALLLYGISLSSALILTYYLQQQLGADILSIYGLLGVSVTPSSPKIILLVPLLISAIYGFFLYHFFRQSARKAWFYVGLCLFFYAQGTLVYYIWYTELSHLLSMNSVWVLLLVLIFQQCLLQVNSYRLRQGVLVCSVLLVFFLLYLPSLSLYYRASNAYNKVFATHQVYQWDFLRARFLSTMDPAPFANSIQLIDHYSSMPAIYMLSKYDNFLPFLAAKYCALPFEQVDTSIVSKKEYDLAVAIIQRDRPHYLFIDNDIAASHFKDIVQPNSLFAKLYPLSYEYSLGRALVLTNLQLIFDAIRPDYKPIAKGELITVYERIKS